MKKVLWLVLLCSVLSAQAKEAQSLIEDPEIYARTMRISNELRCLVCQGQSLGDSNSGFAKDMRQQITEMMESGMNDRQVIEFMVERYGDYVLYRPPFKATTVLLWFGPFILLGAGVAVLYFNVRRRRPQVDDVVLSAEERRQAAELLKEDAGDDKA